MTAPTPKRVLLVEDQDDVARVLMLAITQQGHVVEHASSGAAAIACLSTFTPDVAIIDLGLPDRPGEQVAQHLRSSSPNIRLVGVTGRAIAALTSQQRGLFDHMVQKPFALDDILRLL